MADAHKRFKEFQVGDYVIIRVRPERFSSITVKKLQARGTGPFKIVKWVGSDAHVVELPSDLRISSTFNVSDMVSYKDPTVILSELFEPSPSFESDPTPECPPVASVPARREQIEGILDE